MRLEVPQSRSEILVTWRASVPKVTRTVYRYALTLNETYISTNTNYFN